MERESAHSTSHKTPYRRVNDRAGFALAASVSAVAIVGLLQFGQPAMMTAATQHYETDIQSQHLAMASTHTQSAVVDIEIDSQALAYASFDGDSVNQQLATMASTASVESTVYDYLVDFSQYAVAAPLEGSIPAVNLASYRMY